MSNIVPQLALILIFSALVNWRTAFSLECYRCGLTKEKLKNGGHRGRDEWPDTSTARRVGLVECEEPVAKEFLIKCPTSEKCHTIKWKDGQYTPIRFCLPTVHRNESCEQVLSKLKGDTSCHECHENGCNV